MWLLQSNSEFINVPVSDKVKEYFVSLINIYLKISVAIMCKRCKIECDDVILLHGLRHEPEWIACMFTLFFNH